ncbi:MAG: nuclear transport factor 2 family protein [Rhodothermales bacterium]
MRLFLAAALLVMATSCQQNTPPEAEAIDHAKIEASITSFVDGFVDAIEKTDMDRAATHWLAEAMVGSQGMLLNKEELVAAIGPAFENLERQDLNLTSSNIEVISSNVAAMSAAGVFTATNKEGVTSPEQPFAWTFVFVKDAGEWKILQSHQSFGQSN